MFSVFGLLSMYIVYICAVCLVYWAVYICI